MSLRRFNPKRDSSERGIVKALRGIGVAVQPLSIKGFPDLLTWTRRDGFRLLEVKTGKAKLNAEQLATTETWPVWVVRSVTDALSIFGVRDPGGGDV